MKLKEVVAAKRVVFLILENSVFKKLAGLCLILILLNLPVSAEDEKTSRELLKEIRKQAEQAMRRGEFAAAELLWQKLVEIQPKDDAARLGLSYSLLKQRKFNEAFNQALRIAQRDSNKLPAFNNCEINLPEGAVRSPDSGSENCQYRNVNRNAGRANALIGGTFLGVGAFPKAIYAFRIALAFNPEESLALAGLGLIDFYENRSTAALKKLRQAVFINGNEPDFVFALAQISARTENYKEAADAYARFLRVAPETDADRRARILGLIDFLRYLGNQKSIYSVSGAKTTNVDFETLNNRPLIKVRINGGKDELRFILDTGSGMTVISEETAQRLKLKSVARGGAARAIGGGGKFEIVYGFLSSLEIGDVRVSSIPVYVRRFYSSSESIDGYIGLAVISKFLTTVDYGQQKFSLVRQSNQAKPNNIVPAADKPAGIPLRLTSSGFLSGEVKLSGIEFPLNFIIDTGASISVVSLEVANSREVSLFTRDATLRVFGAAGVTEDVVSLVLPRISLGTFSRERIPAAVLDLKPINETSGYEQAGILGGNFLQNYRVTFDFNNAVVNFEPNQLKSEENTPRIKSINIDDTPADQ